MVMMIKVVVIVVIMVVMEHFLHYRTMMIMMLLAGWVFLFVLGSACVCLFVGMVELCLCCVSASEFCVGNNSNIMAYIPH